MLLLPLLPPLVPLHIHAAKQIPSDPKLISAPYEPERLSKFFLTSVEQQPQRELLLPADVGVPIRWAGRGFAFLLLLLMGAGGMLWCCGWQQALAAELFAKQPSLGP